MPGDGARFRQATKPVEGKTDLQEFFGVTAHAVAAVLASYLLGLALGSWLLGPGSSARAMDLARHYRDPRRTER